MRDAAQLMWEHDIGCIPVIDDEGQPIAMLTDRDVCMAAYTSGKPLSELSVGSAMSKGVFSCREDDSIATAERIMRDWQIRRLPVVGANGKLEGVLSLNDIILARSNSPAERVKERLLGDVTQTLQAICRHRSAS